MKDHGINFIFDSCHKIRELRLKGLNNIEGLPLRRAPVEMPKLAVLDLTDCVADLISNDILVELKNEMTIVLVTNLVQQARRLADQTMFLNSSKLVEIGPTEKIFNEPDDPLTYKYVTGGFG